MKMRYLQCGITTSALLIATAHLIWPNLTIDPITVMLILIALVPWLAPLFKSVEFPGGWKIEFQDFERARTRADKAGLLTTKTGKQYNEEYSFQIVAEEDPVLALAGMRIEIEKRLREIAESVGLKVERIGIGKLLRILSEKQLISNEQRSVLLDMIGLLNAAVHGGDVDERAAEWALDVGPRLLNTLETKKQ